MKVSKQLDSVVLSRQQGLKLINSQKNSLLKLAWLYSLAQIKKLVESQ